MLKKAIRYVDFNGNEAEEVLYFNLTESEIVRLDSAFPGGLEEYISKLNAETDPVSILNLFEKVIKSAYGEKSPDGRHFLKNQEAAELFYQSAAYSALFMELVQNAEEAAVFFTEMLSETVKKKQG